MHHSLEARIASTLRILLTIGVVAAVLLPAARGNTPIGFVPMWLIAMPASALWMLRRVRAG